MAKIRYLGSYIPERDMTVGKVYEVRAYSKDLDKYSVVDDQGNRNFHPRTNFEHVTVQIDRDGEIVQTWEKKNIEEAGHEVEATILQA